ncbi:MAG TPA: hydrogenase maturation protease [Candidatus Binataceae bacterium]|nr:hydrogenase maturation protease [Candidatus Binataceae bacterium]
MAARIIGIGQQWAGDDGVGLAVIHKLREFDGQVDLVELDEPTRLIDLLADGADPVVLVDAVLDDGPAGRVLLIDSQTPSGHCQHLLSTHGVGVMEAIELARITHPDDVAGRIFIVGVTVQETSRRGRGLSAAVEAAVQHGAEEALKLARANR